MKRTDYDRLFSSRPVDRLAAIVTSTSRGNGAMAYAFEKAGFTVPDEPPPDEPPAPEPERHPYAGINGRNRAELLRGRLTVDQVTIAAMSDDELAVEMLALQENTDRIRSDLAAFHQDRASREPGWHVRAERAQSALRSRLELCRLEQQRRAHRAAELRKEEADSERLRKRMAAEQAQAAALERERERQHLIAEREQLHVAARAEKRAAFVRHAKAILPAETFAAIWDAVNRELGDFEA